MRRTAELAWIGGTTELSVEVPAQYAPAEQDISPFVPAALFTAMRRAEPLQIDGHVSRRLFESVPHLQEVISWLNPSLRRIPVRAAAVDQAPVPPQEARGSFFSRGVDSTHCVSRRHAGGEQLDFLLFWRDFELLYSERTRAREVELVKKAAERLGVPEVVVVSSDVPRALVGVVDFNDATSAMLATVGLSVPGLTGHLVVPSAVPYGELTPIGTHPLLDPLWSTERVELEHDSNILSRDEKVGWLVENRPDMLELLHVCMNQDAVDNCGRCDKCLWTMLFLHLHGGLAAASTFPERLDPELLATTPRPAVHHLLLMERTQAMLGSSPEDVELKRAVRRTIRKSAKRPMPRESLSMIAQFERRLHFLLRGRVSDVSTARSGTASAEVGPLDPAWPPPREAAPGRIGLVRAVDHDARRHRYAPGGLPAGHRSGELGALLADRPAEGVPLVLGDDGMPRIGGVPAGASPGAVARWVLEPLAWRRAGPLTARLRSVARRTADATTGRRLQASGPGRTAGWLHASGGNGRVELFVATHPALDDVLLTTDRAEALELGYRDPAILGFLEAQAPVTGALGPAAASIPWARHWGRRS